MANQWALLIGINRYTAMQPLMYAQADAVALRNFFVDELGVLVENCTLLTDMATSIEPYAHLPSRQEIESQLRTFCQEKVQPGDLLWVFFSGYGLASEGQDYWMAIDADPQALSEDAIAVSTVFDILKTAKTDQVLLVLDVNRSQGAVGHQNIGEQTLLLAKDFGVATLISCQPEQYSHETMAVRHGLFTKALLEGLRYHGCVTLAQLAAYLGDRVPELSQHHWRPIQNPVAVIPPAQKFMMVVPADGLSKLPVTERAALKINQLASASETASVEPVSVSNERPLTTAANGSVSSVAAPVTSSSTAEAQQPSNWHRGSEKAAPESSAIVATASNKEDAPGLSRLWQFGIAAVVAAFLAGVFVQYRPILLGRGESSEQSSPPATAEPSNTSGEEGTTPVGAQSAVVETDEGETTAGDASESAGETESAEGGNASNASEEGESASAGLFPPESTAVAEASALERAEAAIDAGSFGEAQSWLSQVPPDQRDDDYEDLLRQTNDQLAQAATRNRGALDAARQNLQPLSASRLNDAIEAARQIPREDPYYEWAQQDIARWSQVIFDLAEGRAASGNLEGAIAAASLVPSDQITVHELAQQQIDIWQGQIGTQELIRQAETAVVPGQASSFQDAIRELQRVSADQPGYGMAKDRIDQWSQDILAIARARAAQGNLSGAIAAAVLVPRQTAAYAQAQQELQRWREQS